jgi:hypothetical protein
MLKRIVAPVILLALVGGVAAYAVFTQPTIRPDCPGKIVCPLTGELVCKDRCPLGEADTTDDSTALPCCQRSK